VSIHLLDDLLGLQLFSNGAAEEDVASAAGRNSAAQNLQLEAVVDNEEPEKLTVLLTMPVAKQIIGTRFQITNHQNVNKMTGNVAFI
jgi:hypothetical protein